MVAAIALVDLDDTLFQTRRKCPPDVPASALTPFSWTATGEAISFATPAQMALIDWLRASTRLVVVTARSGDALTRTCMDYDLAVVAHGGGIVDHHPNSPPRTPRLAAEWRAIMTGRIGDTIGLERVLDQVRASADSLDMGVRARIIDEEGLPLYVVVKHALTDGNDPELHAVCAGPIAALPSGWTAHINGNNVAIMPPGLGKRTAVEWLLPMLKAEHPNVPVIGIGDSFTDAGFMQLCDFAMTPTGSQLAGRLFADGHR